MADRIPRFWLYRTGRSYVDANSHRAVWGETWLSEDEETDETQTRNVLDSAAGLHAFPFGLRPHLVYTTAPFWCARLYPTPKVFRPLQTVRDPFANPNLNVNAPESAFRVQRVGVAADGAKFVGRCCIPILTDDYYTDLPYRRHVDVSTLQPWLNSGLGSYPKTRVDHGRTYKNVVFQRSTLTWSPVDHFTIKANPVRVWQRWRTYDYASRGTIDRTYTPSDL